MKVVHQSATIAFCPDLTSPNALSIPVGVLLVGAADGLRFAAVAALVPISSDGLDPITVEMLRDVPALIKDHVDSVLSKLPPDVSMETILTSLHHRLRNSLHVADIASAEEAEVVLGAHASSDDRAEAVVSQLVSIAVNRLHAAREQFKSPPVPSSFSSTPASKILTGGMPSHSVWPLTPSISSKARALA